jgi:hypothetical protein
VKEVQGLAKLSEGGYSEGLHEGYQKDKGLDNRRVGDEITGLQTERWMGGGQEKTTDTFAGITRQGMKHRYRNVRILYCWIKTVTHFCYFMINLLTSQTVSTWTFPLDRDLDKIVDGQSILHPITEEEKAVLT